MVKMGTTSDLQGGALYRAVLPSNAQSTRQHSRSTKIRELQPNPALKGNHIDIREGTAPLAWQPLQLSGTTRRMWSRDANPALTTVVSDASIYV